MVSVLIDVVKNLSQLRIEALEWHLMEQKAIMIMKVEKGIMCSKVRVNNSRSYDGTTRSKTL